MSDSKSAPKFGAELEKLTRHHALKLTQTVNCSVEQAVLAVGEVVDYDSVKSASHMEQLLFLWITHQT